MCQKVHHRYTSLNKRHLPPSITSEFLLELVLLLASSQASPIFCSSVCVQYNTWKVTKMRKTWEYSSHDMNARLTEGPEYPTTHSKQVYRLYTIWHGKLNFNFSWHYKHWGCNNDNNQFCKLGECRPSVSKQCTVALNCWLAKALPVKYQITAHRLCMAYN